MIDKVIYFVVGLAVATLLSMNYFSPIINDQNALITSDFRQGMSAYKGAFSHEALTVIESNNAAIRIIMDNEPDALNAELARTLLASTLLLDSMTLQDLDTKRDVFLSALLFYKKSSSEEEMIDTIPLLIESCKLTHALTECTHNEVSKLLAMIK